METSENGPLAGEVSENKVNVATRQAPISDISGGGAREKNWPKECASGIDAGFNGGGLRRFSRLRKYVEYLKSCHHKAILVKTNEKLLRFAFGATKGAIQQLVPRYLYGRKGFQTGAR